MQTWNRAFRVRIFLCLSVLAPCCCTQPRIGWADEKQGAFVSHMDRLDEDRWYLSDGWSNGSIFNTDWRRSQVRPRNGMLEFVLEANPASKQGFSSGEMQSRAFYRYGYFETKYKAAKGDGIDSGFFTYTGPSFNSPWDEIDFEFLGKNTRQVQLNYYAAGKGGHEKIIDLPFDAAEEIHTYGFDWSPKAIRWYIDGRLVHEATDAQDRLPENPQKIFIDLWNGKGVDAWLKPFVWNGTPVVAAVECIAYQPARGKGPDCSSR